MGLSVGFEKVGVGVGRDWYSTMGDGLIALSRFGDNWKFYPYVLVFAFGLEE